MQGFIWGQILRGGNLHICLYVCIYTHVQRGAAQCILFNDIKNHIHACSMHIRYSYRIMMKMRQWQSVVMYVMRGRYACGMIVDSRSLGGVGVCSPRKIFSFYASQGDN